VIVMDAIVCIPFIDIKKQRQTRGKSVSLNMNEAISLSWNVMVLRLIVS
jgi:hypothetical protein